MRPAVRGQAGPFEGGHELQTFGPAAGATASMAANPRWSNGMRASVSRSIPDRSQGPCVRRARLEYAVDSSKSSWLCSENEPAYGVGVNPFSFKWALDRHSHVFPISKLGVATLFNQHNYQHKGGPKEHPASMSTTTSAASSAFPSSALPRQHQCGSPATCHISNAGLARPSRHQYHSVSFGFGMFSQQRIVSVGTRSDSSLGVSVVR